MNIQTLEHPAHAVAPGRNSIGNLSNFSASGPAAAVAAASVWLAGCGSGSSSPGAPAQQFAYQIGVYDAVKPQSEAEASRFLIQAQCFASRADIADLLQNGFQAWLNRQFDTGVQQTSWDWLIQRGIGASEFKFNIPNADQLAWRDLFSAPDTLRKRVALVLSEIIVVSLHGLRTEWRPFYIAAYWDLLNNHAFGNFRDLIETISLNPAMGQYLNTLSNTKADPLKGSQPDENYARELMQLFTIGLHELNLDGTLKKDADGNPVESYSHQDVSELAKVFTGWRLDRTGVVEGNPTLARNPMRLSSSLHSTESINFLGISIPANTPGREALKLALDVLFQHPNTGPFISRQIIQKMVTSNPSPAYVESVARVFENNGKGVRGDLKAVVLAVLMHREAREMTALSNPDFGKLRSPLERLIQWARTFNAKTPTADWEFAETSHPVNSLAQSPFRAPSVFNFYRPNYVPPNSEFARQGLVGPEFQIYNDVTSASYINYMYALIDNQTPLKADYSEFLKLALDCTKLVEQLALLIAGPGLDTPVQHQIASAVETIPANMANLSGQRKRVLAAVLLIFACPHYLIQK